MDIRKLKELVRLMVASDLTELDVRDEHEQVTIKRATPGASPAAGTFTMPMGQFAAPAHAPQQMAPVHHVAHSVGGAPTATPTQAPAPTPAVVHTGPVIESPMVGTFYTAAGPGKPVFVQVGSKVHADTIVCLIEAMKIFNEIKAETSGTIEAILAKNGQAVEFGQPLFRIKPD
ncbi:MAG: acetyl-CoA carboxylase biotin carboxyl carrier protein [Phycisphaerae bacterium]|nr:acetyl-CoA carboxylase biotin carboxyl carrier protein [Phycisphaerae bacterium]